MDGSRSTNLKGFKTLKRGILSSTNTIFPAVSFFPNQEILSGYRNGGLYRIDRYVTAEIYVKQQKPTDSATYLQELSHYFQAMFDGHYDDWMFLNQDEEATVFSYSPLSIQYGSYGEKDKLIQYASIPMIFSSWEQAPEFNTSATIGEYDLRTIGHYLHDFMRTDAISQTQGKFFFSHAYPPIQVGAGVVVSTLENNQQSTRREAGRDNPLGRIDVLIWTKASPFEGALDLNLETVDILKDEIQCIPTMGGRCTHSYITNIQYGINQQAVLYASKIEVETWARKNAVQETIPTEPHTVFVEEENGSLV